MQGSFCRSWVLHVAEEKQERARRAAAQQQLAEQHHRQVLVKGLWEGLGQAVALRRLAHRDAHRHFQLWRRRQVQHHPDYSLLVDYTRCMQTPCSFAQVSQAH